MDSYIPIVMNILQAGGSPTTSWSRYHTHCVQFSAIYEVLYRMDRQVLWDLETVGV